MCNTDRQRKNGTLIIYAKIEGMEYALLYQYSSTQFNDNVIFELDVQKGLSVKIVSEVGVMSAKWLMKMKVYSLSAKL